MPSDRRLVVTENASANGVIEFLDPWFDPSSDTDVDDVMAVMREQMAAEEVLLLGRQTFEDFRGYWPLQTDDQTGITTHLNQVDKRVVTTSLTELEWENSTVLGGDLVQTVRELKATPGGEIGVTGSISVVHTLLGAGLVDELRLFVYPVLTARGRNILPEGSAMQPMTLRNSTTFGSGVQLLCWTLTTP